MADSRDLSAVLEAGKQIGTAKNVDGSWYTVIPSGDKVHDLENLMAAPRRIRAELVAHDVPTFVDYFSSYANGIGRIFANRDQFQIVGILDYHDATPRWCSHQITYTAPRSPQWITWTGSNGRKMAQPEFAQFIENNVDDIRDPPGADMLEIARNLQAKKEVAFSSAIRLANGEQEFTYSEMIQGTSAKGKMKVPERFILGIPVFLNDQHYAVEARLRYRITEGKLVLWYDLYHNQRIEADAFNTIITEIADKTAVPVWQGIPG